MQGSEYKLYILYFEILIMFFFKKNCFHEHKTKLEYYILTIYSNMKFDETVINIKIQLIRFKRLIR